MEAKVFGRCYPHANTIRPEGETKVQLSESVQCSHPAASLKKLDLIPGAVMCGECGAIFKFYSLRQATLLGLEEGWIRLDPQLLQAEIVLAFRPYIHLIQGIQKGMGALPFEELDALIDFAPHNYPVEQLEKGE